MDPACRPAGGARPGRTRAAGPAAAPPSPAAHCTCDGAFAGTDATFGAGRSLEFEATFGAATFQHVGFTDNFNSAWAMFSTRGSNNQLFTSTNTGGGASRHPDRRPVHRLGAQATGSSGTRARSSTTSMAPWSHTDNATFGSNLNVAASDFNSGGPGLSVNWLHLSPYPSSGTFTSRVFDAGQAADWGAMSWHAERSTRDQPGDERPHRQHPDPRRELERLHPGHFQRRRRPRQLPLRAVPGRPRARAIRT